MWMQVTNVEPQMCNAFPNLFYLHADEPRHEKTCFQDLRPGKTQTSLISYRDQLES